MSGGASSATLAAPPGAISAAPPGGPRAEAPAAAGTDEALRARIHALREGLEHGLIGCTGLVERLLIGLLTGGHLLIEGAPGLAKTRAVKRLSDGLDGSFARVQCTPDLMPADLT